MSKRLFKSSFIAHGHTWGILITRTVDDGSAAETIVADGFRMAIPAITLEWKRVELHEPIMSSSCTIVCESPGYDTFQELYTVGAPDVELRVYRDGVRYWIGTLDPEQYSEPYDSAAGFDVTLVFSDFGPLQRTPFEDNSAPGTRLNLYNIVRRALDAVSLGALSITENHGLYDAVKGVGLSEFSVMRDNFFDEDGEPMTYHDVLSGILQPLGLRMVQVPGSLVSVHDIEALRKRRAVPLEWTSTGQTLSIDSVYSKLNVNYSPYGTDGGADASISDDAVIYSSGSVTYYYDLERTDVPGFVLSEGEWEDGCSFINVDYSRVVAGRIEPVYSGQETSCLLAGIYRNDLIGPSKYPTTNTGAGTGVYNSSELPIFSAPPLQLTAVPDGLRVQLELLFDVRYNPFEEAGQHNEKGHYKDLQEARLGQVKACIWIEAPDGTRYYYDNTIQIGQVFTEGRLIGKSEWTTTPTTCYLAYRNWDSSKGAVTGSWMKNRQFGGKAPALVQERRGDGEFIPSPPEAGTLHVDIYNGFNIFKSWLPQVNPSDWFPVQGTDHRYNWKIWLGYKSIKVTAVDRYGNDLTPQDISYSADLYRGANDPLDIDTVCGSILYSNPTARGVLFYKGQPLDYITRNTHRDKLEGHLIAGIASQYDTANIVLSGEIDNETSGPFSMATPRSDVAQKEGTVLLPVEASVDVCSGTVEGVFRQVNPPDYETETTISKQ